jgi:hypothetical protein
MRWRLRDSDITRYPQYMLSREVLDRMAVGEPGRTPTPHSVKSSVTPALDPSDSLPKDRMADDPPFAPTTTVGGEPRSPHCAKLAPSALPSWLETILFAPIAALRWLFGTMNTAEHQQPRKVTPPLEGAVTDLASPQPEQPRRAINFYIYENWAHGHTAKVHYAQCSQCNYGDGTHGRRSTPNGRWLGPFESFEAAVEEARGRGATAISPCRSCTPC